jgi:hypothetical protein
MDRPRVYRPLHFIAACALFASGVTLIMVGRPPVFGELAMLAGFFVMLCREHWPTGAIPRKDFSN